MRPIRTLGTELDDEISTADVGAFSAQRASLTKHTRKPKVLIVESLNWRSTAQLANAFVEAGCDVEAVCRRGHAMSFMDSVNKCHKFRALRPLSALRSAIDEAQPNLIVPCDDRVAAQLHRLYEVSSGEDHCSKQRRLIIARSLGAAEFHPITRSRSQLIAMAQELGLHAPDTRRITSQKDLRQWLARHGCPAVIKADGSWGGQGVNIASATRIAERAYKRLSAPPPLARVIKRALVNHDLNLAGPWFNRRRPDVSVQAYISGRPANVAVACWQGEVLATFSVEAVRTMGDTGRSTLVRTIRNPEMAHTVELMVERLHLSGLCGFDFMIDANDGHAHLIELNPRATPTCHLGRVGGELVSALVGRLRGDRRPSEECSEPGMLIALVPEEMQSLSTGLNLPSSRLQAPAPRPGDTLASRAQRRRRGRQNN